MTYTWLILFDIDGTLLWHEGIGREAMRIGLEEVFPERSQVTHYL